MKKYNSANDDEFRKLSERSNALLDKHRSEQPGFDPNDETTAAEIALIGGQLSPQGFAEVGDVEKAEHLRAEGIARDEYLEDPEQFTKCRKREQIIAAKDNYDLARLFSLVGYDPELRLFAVSYKRRPGHQKQRPRDYSDVKRALLNYLISEVDLLWRLWKRHAILVYDPKNIAVRVVAQRAAKLVGIDSDELEKQINSRRRRRKT